VLKQGGGDTIERDFDHARRLGLCYVNGSPQMLAQASHWLETAHKVRPGDADVALYLAQSYAWSGRHEDAARLYQELQSRSPRNSDYVVGLANVLYAKSDVAGALSVLDRFTQDSPSNIPVRLLYARFLGYSKQYVPAIAQYQQVLQADPRNVEASVGIAKVTSWQGDTATAIQLYDQILKSNPRNYDALVGKAFALLWAGRKLEARQLFVQLNERNPQDKEIVATLRTLPAPPPARSATAPIAAKKMEKAESVERPTTQAMESAVPRQARVAVADALPTSGPTPPQEESVRELLAAAQQSSNEGNFAETVHRYHEALAVDDHNPVAALQLARVLSWSKSYDDSVRAYDEFIAAYPSEIVAKQERARVLSWAKRYPEALAGYEDAIAKASECVGMDCPNERALRMEYARVLSWSGRYEQSLAEYEKLQLPAVPRNEDDRRAALERARVLAWSKRYQEARQQFEAVEQSGGDTFEARLGKAQVIYWSGDLRNAAVQLRRLSLEKPKDPDVALTLAAVEHNLGYNSRALSQLSLAGPGSEADSLRHTIRADMRPVLRFRYGYEDDLEIESNDSQSTIKVVRYTTSVEFNIHPDVRLEVFNSVTNALTSNPLLAKHSGDNAAVETLARMRFRIAPWLSLALGGGVGVSGGSQFGASAPHQQHALFEVHPTINAHSWRIDLGAVRRLGEYTPLAIADNVVQTRLTAALSRQWKRFSAGAEYWHAYYQVDSPEPVLRTKFSASGDGGSLFASATTYRNEHFTAELGMRYDSFGFDRGGLHISDPVSGIGSAGFFTPRLYQRYAGTSRFSWTPKPAFRLDVGGNFGPQRVFGYSELSPPAASWGTTGGVEIAGTYNFRRLSLTPGYSFFSTETASFPGLNSGTYQSHAGTLQLAYRF
jgi:tetratricopeptide (TPR) repeat protein